MAQRLLLIDRDGTIIKEPPTDFQVDSIEKLEFVEGAIESLSDIYRSGLFQFVMVTNQDGLGTASFPEETFWPAHNLMMQKLSDAGVVFKDVLIDRSFPSDNAPTRKPRTGLLKPYMTPEYDLKRSVVIGDRITDLQLAVNLGSQAILIHNPVHGLPDAKTIEEAGCTAALLKSCLTWDQIQDILLTSAA